jgi:hypothetical protein
VGRQVVGDLGAVGPDPIGREVAAQELAVEGEAELDDHGKVGPTGPADGETDGRGRAERAQLGHERIVPRRAAVRR